MSSYAPLFVLLAYENRQVRLAWTILAGVAVLSVLVLVMAMVVVGRGKGSVLVVAHATPKDGDVMAYIATYLVPFFDLELKKTDHVVALVGFLVVLGIVYVNSNMIFVNPLLSLAKYHSFDVDDADGNTYSLLTRRKEIPPRTRMRPSNVTGHLRVESRSQERAKGGQGSADSG